MIVSIVGLPGVGKTSFGQALANELNLSFVDLDQAIEARANTSIQVIFEKHGEDYFRTLEKSVLESTLSLSNIVLATGGGTPAYSGNMKSLTEHSIVVYLQDEMKAIVERLITDETNRPLFTGLNDAQLSTKLDSLFEKRIHYYRQSHIITGFEASKHIQLFTNRLDLFTK